MSCRPSAVRRPGGAVDLLGALPRADDAVVQSIGTLLFNVTTVMALSTTLSNPEYDRLVWRPDAIGSACFLACAAATLRTGRTVKSPWVSRLERTVERLV